jgi:hypothetical protein
MGRLWLGVCALVGLPLAAGCDLLWSGAHPPDAALIRNFREHEADFKRLLAMSNEDAKVIRIAYDFTRLENNWSWPRPESELGFSRQRWDEYRALFAKLGLEAGLERAAGDDGAAVYLTASALGLGISGSSKGYLYMTTAPEPLLDSLNDDDVRRHYQQDKTRRPAALYKRIDGNWYLFRD